jgi:hypothetical protein
MKTIFKTIYDVKYETLGPRKTKTFETGTKNLGYRIPSTATIIEIISKNGVVS